MTVIADALKPLATPIDDLRLLPLPRVIRQRSVIAVPKPSASRDHPTMKPVELVARCLTNSAPPRGGLVLDPFGGSGSTLMACEYTGRKARLIELDPRYVDVICRRWQSFTGSSPVLESSGEAHDFAA